MIRPRNLNQCVTMANLLDPQLHWPRPADLDEPLKEQTRAFGEARTPEERIEAFEHHAKGLAVKDQIIQPVWQAALQQFPAEAAGIERSEGVDLAVLPQPTGPPFRFNNAGRFYEAAFAVRETLTALATRTAGIMELTLPLLPPRVQVAPNGTIHLQRDFGRDVLLPALGACDVGQIQICSAVGCGKLFLKARTDQDGCSPPCANIVRVKQFRDRNPDYYTAAQRRERKARRVQALVDKAKKGLET